jgi:hypothetical protein
VEKDIEIMLNAFPKELKEEIKAIFKIITLKTKSYNGEAFDVFINNEIIHIPERIYHEDLEANVEIALSQIQKHILDCFFTRHHNGYIRQKRLNNIFTSRIIYNWSIPYIVRLMGEYVVEIIDDINTNIQLIDKIALQEFIRTNQKFILTTEGRIASYWGEFYKLEYAKDKYVGFKVKKYIQSLRKNLGNS